MKRFILAVAIAAVAMFTLAGTASADVPRYQFQYVTLTGNVNNGAFIHTYTMGLNPCNGVMEFVGNGTVSGGTSAPGGIPSLVEIVTGSYDGSTLVFHSQYTGYNPTYHWDFTGPLSGGAANSGVYSIVWSMAPGAEGTIYRNHGDFVSQMPDKNDAAHSCIGKPVEFSFEATGSIPANNNTGVNQPLPDAGLYRIDVAGTWHNNSWGDVDAEYAQYLGVWYDGFDHPATGYMLGEGFGDVQVNGQFVSWGGFNPAHTYTLYTSLPAGEVNFRVFDGDSGPPPVLEPWYGDNNVGSLTYKVTYVGP